MQIFWQYSCSSILKLVAFWICGKESVKRRQGALLGWNSTRYGSGPRSGKQLVSSTPMIVDLLKKSTKPVIPIWAIYTTENFNFNLVFLCNKGLKQYNTYIQSDM